MIDINVDSSVLDRWSGESVLSICILDKFENTKVLSSKFDLEVKNTISELNEKGKEIFNDNRVIRMRATFRAMPDMDPTRYRPASESLIRRCLEKGFFNIMPLVDINNLMSIKLRIPLGIYDLDRLKTTFFNYRIGYTGEKYFTITKQPKNADGKLVLADFKGVVGSPVADSNRSKISDNTNRVAVVAFLPIKTSKKEAKTIIKQIEDSFINNFNPAYINSKII